MNTYRNCLLTLAICSAVSLSNLSASELTIDVKKSHPNIAAPNLWGQSDKSTRFGRNVRTDRVNLQGRNRICFAPSKVCQCKKTSNKVSCRILKRR